MPSSVPCAYLVLPRGHLEALLDTLPATDVLGPVRDELAHGYLAETRQMALAEALDAMRGERYLDLLDVLRAVSLAPPTSAKARQSINKAASWLLHRELERVAKRVEAANGYEDSSITNGSCTRCERQPKACGTP